MICDIFAVLHFQISIDCTKCYTKFHRTEFGLTLKIWITHPMHGDSGGNLGGAGGAAAPPPTFVENDEISTFKRAKNSLFECKWGGLSEI